MKTIKRNAVIVTVLMFVCAAVYLNWSYNKRVEDAASTGDGGLETMEPAGDLGSADSDAKPDTLGAVSDEGDAGLYYSVNTDGKKDEDGGEADNTAANPYAERFAQARLERSQARDQAAATLQAVAGASGASQETVDGALSSMARMAELTVKEAEIESLIKAKGFIDCVVYLTDDGAKVTVAADGGLNQASVAKITDVVVSETGIAVDKLTVTEVK